MINNKCSFSIKRNNKSQAQDTTTTIIINTNCLLHYLKVDMMLDKQSELILKKKQFKESFE